ncbi:MAG: hypothetical protein Q7U53_07990 [Anaerolineaceae bacterium]|nr:hypothetical protein [Anaerolineaceae bacterium]
MLRTQELNFSHEFLILVPEGRLININFPESGTSADADSSYGPVRQNKLVSAMD